MRSSTLTFSALLLLAFLLVACRGNDRNETIGGVEIVATGVVEPEPTKQLISAADLPSQGAAPEILNETWLNAESPYTIESQRGKVVLLKFWTFG